MLPTAVNQLRVADITYVRLLEAFVYLASIMSQLIGDFALKDFQAAGILGNIGVRVQRIHETSKLDKDSDRANYGFMKLELSTE